jgi:hypothetical protein
VAFLERPVLPAEQKPRTALNPAAVALRNGKPVVFRVEGSRVRETAVRLGSKLGDVQEVVSGVKAGDKIVLNPLEKLKNDSKIKVKEK